MTWLTSERRRIFQSLLGSVWLEGKAEIQAAKHYLTFFFMFFLFSTFFTFP